MYSPTEVDMSELNSVVARPSVALKPSCSFVLRVARLLRISSCVTLGVAGIGSPVASLLPTPLNASLGIVGAGLAVGIAGRGIARRSPADTS